MEKENNYFETDNFACACFLLANGFELHSLEPADNTGAKFFFNFRESEELRASVEDYFDLRGVVRPQDFVNAQRNLRSILYQKRQSI